MTYNDLKEGDSVICFTYREETVLLGSRGAVKDLN